MFLGIWCHRMSIISLQQNYNLKQIVIFWLYLAPTKIMLAENNKMFVRSLTEPLPKECMLRRVWRQGAHLPVVRNVLGMYFLSWNGYTNIIWWSSGWQFVACRCAALRKQTLDLSGGQCAMSCFSNFKGKLMETRQFHWYFTVASPESRPQHYWNC